MVSHEHKGHSLSVKNLIQADEEVFASEGIAAALDCNLITTITEKAQFQVGSTGIVPFAIFHERRSLLCYTKVVTAEDKGVKKKGGEQNK